MTIVASLRVVFKGRNPARPDFALTDFEIGYDIEDGEELYSLGDAGLPDNELVGMTVGIEYVDAKRDITQRHVSIVGFSQNQNGDHLMRAHCFLRDQLRTFRLDRIKAVYDVHGEVFETAEFFDLAEIEFSESRIQGKKPGSKHKSIARDGMRLLIALARADGYLHPDEVEVIIGYAEAEGAQRDLQLTPGDEKALRAYIGRQQPTGDVVADCLIRLSERDEESLSDLMWYLGKLMDVDGVQDAAEFDFMLKVKERLALI